MAKPFYVDYVNHMLRYYTRCDHNTKSNNAHEHSVDKLNYNAVNQVMCRLSDRDKEIIESVYITDDPFRCTLETLNYKLCITIDEGWKVISQVSRMIAKERMLI